MNAARASYITWDDIFLPLPLPSLGLELSVLSVGLGLSVSLLVAVMVGVATVGVMNGETGQTSERQFSEVL